MDEDRGGAPAGTEVEEPCNGTVNLPQVVFIVTLVLIGSAWLGEMLIKHI